MKERDLVAVAESVGDDRGRTLKDEVVECAVAGTEVTHADQTQAVHDRVRMKVISGVRAGEQPWVSVSAGA